MKAGTFVSVIYVSVALASGALAQSPAVAPDSADLQPSQSPVTVPDQAAEAPAQSAATPEEIQALHTALRARLAELRH